MKYYAPVARDKDISEKVLSSYKLKPRELFMNELVWKFSVRNVLRGENLLFVGQSGSAKTMTAQCLAEALGRPLFNIPLGSTQDPRSSLIGNTHFKKDVGTVFSESAFVEAIQTPNAIIMLEEISRAHPDAWNILMPVLDQQRILRLEEKQGSPVINVAPGVSFTATANIGTEYTGTRVLDRALVDRFVIIEIPTLNKDEEYNLLKQRYPDVDSDMLHSIADICTQTRVLVNTEASPLTTSLSTRTALKIAGLINDGFTLLEASEIGIFPFFSSDGGTDSERTYIKQLVQKYIKRNTGTSEPQQSNNLFTPDDFAAVS